MNFPKKSEYMGALIKFKQEFEKRWSEKSISPVIDFSDYTTIATIGSGSFGVVKLCRPPGNTKYYAIKVITKSDIVKKQMIRHVIEEKKVLASIKFPFLIYLEFSFKDNDYLYLGLPYINGGDLFKTLRKEKRFSEELTRFYAAQVFLALEYLHYLNLIYRDLKPENILLDGTGYIKLTDFGFCKQVTSSRTWTLCGTPEYIAPEIIEAKSYSNAVDWWTYGVLLFEFAAGYSPFSPASQDSQMILFSKIVAVDYTCPSHFSADLKNLIDKLLQKDLTQRYGNLKNGPADIRNHDFFKHIKWVNILKCKIDPPYVPKTKGPYDYSNYDKHPDVGMKRSKTNQYEHEFQDF